MCSETKCSDCKKASWSGCGQHLDPIFARIPPAKRCYCGYTEEELENAKASDGGLERLYPKGSGGCVIC